MKPGISIIFYAWLVLSLTSCLEDPSASLDVDKTDLAVGEPVTISLNDLENYTCIGWRMQFDGEFTTISGGEGDQTSWTVSFDTPGNAVISTLVKNCKKKDNNNLDLCICEKNHITSSYELNLTIN